MSFKINEFRQLAINDSFNTTESNVVRPFHRLGSDEVLPPELLHYLASLFDNGILPQSDDYYRAKDVEEMNGHFLMFNKMLDTFDEILTPELY